MPADANAGRVWVESADSGRWRLLLRPQQLDQLKQVLEPRGAREGGLHAALLRVEGAVRAAMPGTPMQMPMSLGGCAHFTTSVFAQTYESNPCGVEGTTLRYQRGQHII
jgi:hypothetical protein